MASLGPSEQLLRDAQVEKISWNEFTRRYRAELFEDAPIDRRSQTIKNHGQKLTLRLLKELGKRGPVTLMYGNRRAKVMACGAPTARLFSDDERSDGTPYTGGMHG
jgi:uncharacterized protein YeaO (DUF488 family)